MKHLLLRGLLLVLVLLVSLLLPIEERLGSAISGLRAVPRDAVFASPEVLALNGVGSEPVTFSNTAFPKEREVVRRLFADDIRHAEQVHKDPVGSVIIPIALVDLNLSGRMDILAFLDHVLFCGSAGCRFIVLIATTDSHWKIGLDNVNVAGAVRVSKHLTHGFRDLLFGGPSGGYVVWRWDGKEYR